MQENSHVFERLKPDFILDAIEHCGYICDGRILALNSYENRVYQIGVENKEPVIAKFYRPRRWSDEQIIEEHEFSFELVEHELPIVPPIELDGTTLFYKENFRYALYERKGGHAPELDDLDNLYILGRFLGRIHRIGASKRFIHRPAITCAHYGHDSATLLKQDFIPGHICDAYDSITSELLRKIDSIYLDSDTSEHIRVHGDCHVGNILWREDAPHFIDLDDARMAPAIQDIWMLLSGDRNRQRTQLCEIMESYNEFSDFPLHQLKFIEALRTLRIMYYSAWLAKRWEDPAFKLAFPWFNTVQYWEQHILDLREQLGELNEAVIDLQAHYT